MAVLSGKGHTESDMARLLSVSEGTVRYHDKRMRSGAVDSRWLEGRGIGFYRGDRQGYVQGRPRPVARDSAGRAQLNNSVCSTFSVSGPCLLPTEATICWVGFAPTRMTRLSCALSYAG